MISLADLLAEYNRALVYTDGLWQDLTPDEVAYRTDVASSAIGWHLLHQPAVAHFMTRNLIEAEPRLDPELEALADSATPPSQRGELPTSERIDAFRTVVAHRVRERIQHTIDDSLDLPNQRDLIGCTLLIALINHEYQHSTWIAEVRSDVLARTSPTPPLSRHVSLLDGYPVIGLDM